MSAAIKELLPIGSVVLLEGGEKRLMIFGVKQTDTLEDSTSNEYDYIGVLYPEGNMGQDMQFLFNHEDIKEISARGFEDSERDEFIEKLDEVYSSGMIGEMMEVLSEEAATLTQDTAESN